MTVRRAILKVHLYAGISAATFLTILGLTGGLLAFDDYYDRWLHPSLWRVIIRDRRINEQRLTDLIQERFVPARVESIRIADPDLALVFSLTNRTEVFVDPFEGTVLGVRDQAPRWTKAMAFVRQFHVRLADGFAGKRLIDAATIEMLVLIPTGFILWWRKKRLKIDSNSQWSRLTWDLHNAVGAYTGCFLLIAAITGFFIAFEPQLYWVTGTSPQRVAPVPRSSPPADTADALNGGGAGAVSNSAGLAGAFPLAVDHALDAADQALPGLATAEIRLPLDRRAPYVVEKRVPQWAAGAAPSKIYIDQYSFRVLRVDDVRGYSAGFRLYHINQSLHTGGMFGLPSRIVVSASSLFLAVLAFTGVMIGWRKLITDVASVLSWLSGRRRAQKATMSAGSARKHPQ